MGLLRYFCVVSLLLVSGYGSPLFPLNSGPIETAESDPVGTYRLPTDIVPLNYKIHITTNIHKEIFQFTGDVTIQLKSVVAKKNAQIVLHARQLEILSAKFKALDNSNPQPDPDSITHKYNEKTEFLTVFSTKNDLELKENGLYELTISYSGVLREDNGGFYRSSYKNTENKKIYLATTQFESTDARHGFPCFDEPGIKATFEISITHGRNYTAISNMPAKPKTNENTLADGTMTTTSFEKTRPMSTYLIAFVVSDFQNTAKGSQRVFSRPGSKGEQEFALKTGLSTLASLGSYLGISYSLPKMDQVAVPDFAAGAMENWGLVTYREEYLLYNSKKSTIYTETSIATIIAHEYAHQWFGNLVSPVWWTYIWLNEGFASLFSYIGTDKVFPEWGIMEYFITAEYQRALEADVGASARPMTHYVEKPKEIVGLFDSISYSKAACVLRMMQNVLTEDIFKFGLNKYLTKKNFSAAEEADLFKGLQEAVDDFQLKLPASVSEIMGSWTNQGGFPLLTVTRDYKAGTFKIEQKTFHDDKTTTDDKTWWIPFNFVTSAKPDFKNTTIEGYLGRGKKSIEIQQGNQNWTNTDWIILNKQQTGYYRVNYDDENWNLIIAALQKDPKVIHTYNRAQLVNDAFRFLLTKNLPVKTMFSLLSYLKQEEEYSPWASANSALNAFNQYLREKDDAEVLHFFIKKIVNPLYTKLGTKDLDNDPHFKRYTRALAIKWACEAGIDDCLENTNSRLRDYVKDNTKIIEPNMQEPIYCYGLKKATDEEFQFLYKRLMDSVDAAERKTIISSLGCSANPQHLKRFLESSINTSENLRPQERITILRAAYIKGPIGFAAALEFLEKNYEAHAKLTPGFSKKNPLMDDITQMSTIVTNTEQKDRLKAILKLAEKHPQYDQKVAEIVDKNVQYNLDWINSYRTDIVDWLKDYQKANIASQIATLPILLVLVSLTHFFY